MGLFNILHAPVACRKFFFTNVLKVRFAFGDTWQYVYELGGTHVAVVHRDLIQQDARHEDKGHERFGVKFDWDQEAVDHLKVVPKTSLNKTNSITINRIQMKYQFAFVPLLLLVFLTQAQKTNKTVNEEVARYVFRYSDNTKTNYSWRSPKGVRMLVLYKDGLFEYEQHFIPNHLSFNAGTWRIVRDSILILRSKQSLKEKIFSRRQHMSNLPDYKQMALPAKRYNIRPGKYLTIAD
jgi:hypothetical protein